MSDTLAEQAVPAPSGDLTPDARDLWDDILDHHGATITTVGFGALVQVVRMISLADRAEQAIGEDWIITGYRGQPVANPLAETARQARTAAVNAMKTVSANLGDELPGTRAGRALAGARWRRTAR